MLLHSATTNFVLLVPLCLIFIGIFSGMLWLQQQHVRSLMWLAISAVCAGTGLLAQSLIPFDQLYKWAILLGFVYQGTFIALAQAIALRFNSQISWPFCIVVLGFNQIGIFYYSWVDAEISVRFAINGLGIFLIFSHIIFNIYHVQPKHQFDLWLKRFTLFLMLCLFVREIYLIYLMFMVNSSFDYTQSYIGFITQFIGLFFQLLFAALLIGTGIQDTLLALDKERNSDYLTGIANRRAFFEKATCYLPPHSQLTHALFVCDIDYFKHINDLYGHAMGDQVLKFFTQQLSSQLNKADLLARIGGEEFVCILHAVSLPEALQIIERMRQALDIEPISQDIPVRVTASFGVVLLSDFQKIEDAIKQADRLMYQAKLSGRNNVQYEVSDS